MNRIQRLSYWLSIATSVVMVIIPALIVMQLWQVPPRPDTAAQLFPGMAVAEAITQNQIWAAIALGLPTLCAMLWTLFQMRRLFGTYRSGDVLTQLSACLTLRIGLGMIALTGLKLLTGMAQSVVLSWAAPAGQRALAVALSNGEVGFLLAAGLLTVIGWAMREAAVVAEDHRGFI